MRTPKVYFLKLTPRNRNGYRSPMADKKFLFSLPIQEGTSTRLAVLILLPGRSVRQEISRRAARRRIRQFFAVSIRKMGWCSTRNPRALRTSRRKGGERRSGSGRLTAVRSPGTGRGRGRREAAATGRGVLAGQSAARWARILRMTGAWLRKPTTRILWPQVHSSGSTSYTRRMSAPNISGGP